VTPVKSHDQQLKSMYVGMYSCGFRLNKSIATLASCEAV